MQTNEHKITATSMCYCLVPSNSNRLLQNPPKSPPPKVANILVCVLGCLQSPSTCTVTSASSYLDILLFILRLAVTCCRVKRLWSDIPAELGEMRACLRVGQWPQHICPGLLYSSLNGPGLCPGQEVSHRSALNISIYQHSFF